MIVATLPNPLTSFDLATYSDHVVLTGSVDPFISHWWNDGLDYIAKHAQTNHEVLTISSDFVGTTYSVAMLGAFMRQNNLIMVGPNPWNDETQIFNVNHQRHAHGRVPGACWMIRGESGLRIDERFRWWYSDDDFEMQARQRSGTGILPGTGLVGEADTPLSEEKERWAVEDRQLFIKKWGMEPW